MIDETEDVGPVMPVPGSLDALQELVDALIVVEVAGAGESDDEPFGAAYRSVLQDLVTAEMKRDDRAPALPKLLTAALQKWAEIQ
jgi:hypothetical protein